MALRVVLDQILQFEKTPCPFKRSFTVRLPERPKTPVVKKPWVPVQGPLPPMSTPDYEMSPSPKPKSLRSAEKKSVARRSSAARDHTPIKSGWDSSERLGRERSISSPRPSDVPDGCSTATASDAEPDTQVEEERGRTLSRAADALAAKATKMTAATEEKRQSANDQGPAMTEDTPTQASEPEKTAEQKPERAGETPTEEQSRDAMPGQESVTVILQTKAAEKASDIAQQPPSSDTESTSEVEIQQAPLEEKPGSDRPLSRPDNIIPVGHALYSDEPWSAHSSEPQTAFVETFSLASQKDVPVAKDVKTKETVPEIAPTDEPTEQKPLTVSPAQAEVTPVPDMSKAMPEVNVAQVTASPRKTGPATQVLPAGLPPRSPRDQTPVASHVLETVAEEAPARVTNPKRLSLRSDIIEGIRPYDQKTAAGTVTSMDVASRSPTDSTHGFVDDDKKSFTSQESGADSFEEQSMEASGEAAIHEGSGTVGARRKKLRGFHGTRSIVVPPQLTLVTSPPSKAAVKQAKKEQSDESNAATSPTDSQDSFHSVQSWHSPITPLPPSPPVSDPTTPSTFPYPHNNILIPKRLSRYEMSDLTVTPETRRTWDAASTGTHDSSQESAATAPDIAVESLDKIMSENNGTSTAVASQRPKVRHRATTSTVSVSRRALSPLPPAANLFSPTGTSSRRTQMRSRPLELVRRVPMAIVAKTCEIFLSPPSHLINLMLRVAGMIAAGEWRGMVFGHGEGGESIPVHWDYSDGELSGDDDEYYMSQAEASRAGSVADRNELIEVNSGRGWEVD